MNDPAWDFNDALVQNAVQGVWETLRDAELQALTPDEFVRLTAECMMTDEECEEAWLEFCERRDRVTAARGWNS